MLFHWIFSPIICKIWQKKYQVINGDYNAHQWHKILSPIKSTGNIMRMTILGSNPSIQWKRNVLLNVAWNVLQDTSWVIFSCRGLKDQPNSWPKCFIMNTFTSVRIYGFWNVFHVYHPGKIPSLIGVSLDTRNVFIMVYYRSSWVCMSISFSTDGIHLKAYIMCSNIEITGTFFKN